MGNRLQCRSCFCVPGLEQQQATLGRVLEAQKKELQQPTVPAQQEKDEAKEVQTLAIPKQSGHVEEAAAIEKRSEGGGAARPQTSRAVSQRVREVNDKVKQVEGAVTKAVQGGSEITSHTALKQTELGDVVAELEELRHAIDNTRLAV